MFPLFLEEITSQHLNLTEAEFDYIAAEWFRFAKQRKERHDKKREGTA